MSLDRSHVEDRLDVLVYTGPVADTPLEIIGLPLVILYAGSDSPDTDWVVSLTDVHADGRSILLSEGSLRARFRESLETEMWMETDGIYEFRIDLTRIGHVLQPGHRLRLRVTSSDFPTYDRNLNTGEAVGNGTEARVARNLVHHDGAHPSRVVLPVTTQGRR